MKRNLPSAIPAILFLLAAASQSAAAPIPKEDRPLHVLNRLAYGPRPGDLEHVRQIGIDRYIDEQLHPETIPVSPELTAEIDQLQTLHMTPLELIRDYFPVPKKKDEKPDPDAQKMQRQRAQVVIHQAVHARFVRAVDGPRQLKEVLTDFWFNHFNVYAAKNEITGVLTANFEEQAIRPNVFGNFRDLLEATARHPAMLVYLDNNLNTAPDSPGARKRFEGINENYARELMELHTLGVDGGYTQQDVIALAHILTGWGIRQPGQIKRMMGVTMAGDDAGAETGIGMMPARFGFMNPRRRMRMMAQAAEITKDDSIFFFDSNRHDSSDKVFLGHEIKGTGPDEVEQALDILAASPKTAHHISYQLAQYFVADKPPESLVARMAGKFEQTNGDLRAVYEVLFHSPEFWDQKYYNAKFKTPYQFVVSAIRAAGVPMHNGMIPFVTTQQLGNGPYMCLTPDGYKNTEEAWLNPDGMMRRLTFATALSAGRIRLDQSPTEEDWPHGKFKADKEPRNLQRVMARAEGGADSAPQPLNYIDVAETLGNRSTPQTAKAIQDAPPQLRAAVILGSPEFMKR